MKHPPPLRQRNPLAARARTASAPACTLLGERKLIASIRARATSAARLSCSSRRFHGHTMDPKSQVVN
jgi:hypothetical protein